MKYDTDKFDRYLSEGVKFDFRKRHSILEKLNRINLRGFRMLSHYAPEILIPTPSAEGIIKLPDGLKVLIDPVNDQGVERALYFTGSYEPGTLSFIKKYLKKGDTFVDVGANIGLMSLVAAKSVGEKGTVLSFEPHPVTAEILRFNIHLNDVPQVEVYQEGLGSKVQKAVIYDRWEVNRGGASVISDKINEEGKEINLTTLTEVIGEKTVDMIKIDVEGFELEVLKGSKPLLQRENPPILIVECTEETEHQSFTRKELYEWLKAVNPKYRFYRLKGSKSRPSRLMEIQDHLDLPTHDNLFCLP